MLICVRPIFYAEEVCSPQEPITRNLICHGSFRYSCHKMIAQLVLPLWNCQEIPLKSFEIVSNIGRQEKSVDTGLPDWAAALYRAIML